MSLTTGPIHDPIERDIREAVREGFFDDKAEAGKSELLRTPVEELLERVSLMSRQKRRQYLASIGHIRVGNARLSSTDGVEVRRRRQWLSR